VGPRGPAPDAPARRHRGAALVRSRERRDDVDNAALAPWIELRELHVAVWRSLYAERQPPPS
jgi:hypothetical protein